MKIKYRIETEQEEDYSKIKHSFLSASNSVCNNLGLLRRDIDKIFKELDFKKTFDIYLLLEVINKAASKEREEGKKLLYYIDNDLGQNKTR